MIGSLAVDDLFRETELEMAADPVDKLGAVATVKHELDRAADRRWITPDLMAQVIEPAALFAGRLRAGRAGAVPYVGVARHQQHHLIAACADPDRWVRFLDRLGVGNRRLSVVVPTIDGGSIVGPQRDHGLDRLTQASHSMIEPLETEHLRFGFGPAGADAELEPAPRKMIHRRGHLC